MNKPIEIAGIRNITISGRIASGATTLAHHLSENLSWEFLDGGKLFRQSMKANGLDVYDTEKRADEIDLQYEEHIKKILKEQKHQIIQSHLAGFDAQGIDQVYKVLVLCEDEMGEDKADIRIDRLANRDGYSVDQAKHEVMEREEQNLAKWRRLYAENNQHWVYWDKKYYDLVINTFTHNQEESLKLVLKSINVKSDYLQP